MILLAASTMWMMTWYVLWHVLWPRPAAESPPDDPVAYLLAPENRAGLQAGAALLYTLVVAYALCCVLA